VTNLQTAVREQVQQEFLDGDPLTIGDDANLFDEEVLDSLGIFLLVEALQDRFGIVIGPNEVTVDNFETIDAISRLVAGKLPSK
jgi:acyl carrier protein